MVGQSLALTKLHQGAACEDDVCLPGHAEVRVRVAEDGEHGDNGTRELFERRLVGEESHADWLESQIELIRQVGVENYLATQIHG